MATNTKLSGATVVAMANAAVDQTETGSGTARLRIYEGTQPAGPDTAISGQTLLAEIDFPDPAFDDATNETTYGQALLLGVPLSDTSANATGTAQFFRVVNQNNDALFDGNIGTSGTDMIIDNPSIASGQTVRLNSYAFRVPKS